MEWWINEDSFCLSYALHEMAQFEAELHESIDPLIHCSITRIYL